MKRNVWLLFIAVALLLTAGPRMQPVEAGSIIDQFELIPEGTKIRVQSSGKTTTHQVSENAVFEFSGALLRLFIDGSLIEEFELPKQPGGLGADATIEGVLSSLTFQRGERTQITLGNGEIWTSMYVRASFATRGKETFIKFFRKRFQRNMGVRIFQVKG